MAHSTDIVGYTYCASIYCPACIVEQVDGEPERFNSVKDQEEALDLLAKEKQIDRYDERTYDSDRFPKVIFRDLADGEQCEGCGEVLGA